jgi:hypothetical protein
MPIISSELQFFLPANSPVEDDTSAVGGAIDLTARPLDAQLAANDQVEILSDGTDTRDVTITGRLADGSPVTETKALSGTTPVVFDATFERIHTIEAASGSGTRTVTIRRDSGGATVHTLNPNEVLGAALFIGAESDPEDPVVRYEKIFARNGNSSLALLGAEVELITDAAALYEIGLGTVGGTAATANRLAVPGGVTFEDDDTPIAVPGVNLAAGAAVEVWIEQTLAADQAAGKPSLTIRLAGASI